MILQNLQQHQGQEVVISNLFNIPAVNVLWQIIMSKRYTVCTQHMSLQTQYSIKVFSDG